LLLVFAQRANDLGDNLLRHLKALQRLSKTLGKVFLPEPWQVALAAMPSATVEATSTENLSGLQKQIAEHEQKLEDYKANPDAYDNKGILKNASPERRQSIINGRVRHLQREIDAFRKAADKD